MDNAISIDFGTDGGMSLFISYLMPSITYEQIRFVFEYQEKLGPIRLIKLIQRKSRAGQDYNMAHIYFKHWYNTPNTIDFQTRIQQLGYLEVKCDSKNHYWKVQVSKFWTEATYGPKADFDCVNIELHDLKDKHGIVCGLLEKYRDHCYNDTYEAIFDRDMRELLGVPSARELEYD